MLEQLVQQQGQIIGLLTTMVEQTKTPISQQPAPVFQQPAPVPQQLAPVSQQPAPVSQQQPVPDTLDSATQQVLVPQLPAPITQQSLIPQLPSISTQQSQFSTSGPAAVLNIDSVPRSSTPTLMDLLESTDDDLHFLNSPSWLSSDTDLPPAPLRGSNSTPLPLLPSLELQSSHSVADLPMDQSSLNLPTSSLNLPTSSLNLPTSSLNLPTSSLNLPTSSSSHSVLQTPETHSRVPPPPFGTPPKLVPVEQVMRDYPGKDLSVLRRMSCALARRSIFGKDALFRSSLRGGGKNKTASLDKEKL